MSCADKREQWSSFRESTRREKKKIMTRLTQKIQIYIHTVRTVPSTTYGVVSTLAHAHRQTDRRDSVNNNK